MRRIAKPLAIWSKGVRAILLQRFTPLPSPDLKALLAAAGLEGVDLERSQDAGRKVDL